MSRSGYSEDCDQDWQWIMYRGRVASAIHGKRGQAFLLELIAALDAMPDKKLIAGELRDDSGRVCAIGSVGAARGMDIDAIDYEDNDAVAAHFGIARAMVCEIEFINDEDVPYWVIEENPEERWRRVRAWAERNLMVKP